MLRRQTDDRQTRRPKQKALTLTEYASLIKVLRKNVYPFAGYCQAYTANYLLADSTMMPLSS